MVVDLTWGLVQSVETCNAPSSDADYGEFPPILEKLGHGRVFLCGYRVTSGTQVENVYQRTLEMINRNHSVDTLYTSGVIR